MEQSTEGELPKTVCGLISQFEKQAVRSVGCPPRKGKVNRKTEEHLARKPDVRILLAGRTGHGKSETGNTILGQNLFSSVFSNQSVTKECHWKRSLRDGKLIEVVDTPGFLDTDVDKEKTERELYRALMLTVPGFHAIGFVITPDRFTAEMEKLVDLFFNFFGDDVHAFSFIIFTHMRNQKELKEFLQLRVTEEDTEKVCADVGLKMQIKKENFQNKLYDLIIKCNGNLMIIDNTSPANIKKQQANAIIAEVERIKISNANRVFRNINFAIVDEMIKLQRETSQGEMIGWDWVPKVVLRWLNPENDTKVETVDDLKRKQTVSQTFESTHQQREHQVLKNKSITLPSRVAKSEVPNAASYYNLESKEVDDNLLDIVELDDDSNDTDTEYEEIEEASIVSFKEEIENQATFSQDSEKAVKSLARRIYDKGKKFAKNAFKVIQLFFLKNKSRSKGVTFKTAAAIKSK